MLSQGMVTSPHHLASEAGLRVLREGGNAIEATIAMAASLAVVYPHMNSLGGDGFWLISQGGAAPAAIDACGGAAVAATPALYAGAGLSAIPTRGPLAANTVAGTVSGWGRALEISTSLGGKLPLSRLVEEAVWSADHGFPVSQSQQELTQAKLAELADVPGFAQSFLVDGQAPKAGTMMRLPALARTLQRIGAYGPQEFYDGALAREIASDLAAIGSPVALSDLTSHQAQMREPLTVSLRGAQLYNFPPPTQGLASLIILALFDRLNVKQGESFDHIHGIVEATKQAFLLRDAYVGDPASMRVDAQSLLSHERLDALAAKIDMKRALPWPQPASAGDTVWMGAMDANGLSVSFIQSIFFEFGSGCVLPGSGIVWQNRGASFALTGEGPRVLAPGRKPFHTLNPAMARFDDGRVMVYGTMGGEGQPQTQAAIFSRYAIFNRPLQDALDAPRWLLGRTWGENSVTLKLEDRFDPQLVADLRAAGHDVELLPAFTSTMGHAGALVRHSDGALEGASDPRSDGAAMGF